MQRPKKTTAIRPVIIIPATFQPLNFAFWVIYNFFALVGIFVSVLVIIFYVQGWRSIAPVDTQFIHLLGNFLEQTLEHDVATALVFKVPVHKTVSLPAAVESMKQTATQLDNIKFLNNYSLSQDTAAAPDKKARHVEIIEFTIPNELEALLDYNADIAAHLPLHIAAYEDAQGQNWLAMTDWSFLVYGAHNLPPEVKTRALGIQDNLLKIIGAAAAGS